MYAMLCIRLDVSYALSVTSIYKSDPSEGHWVAVKNILKYLRRTKDVLLDNEDGDLIMRGYNDVSFQFDGDESISQ